MTKRDSNYELMRIISMFLIVLGHVIFHGEVTLYSQIHSVQLFFELLGKILLVHVNSFVLVTGYYGVKSKFKLMKVIELLLLCLFYSIVITLVMNSLHIINYSFVDFLKTFNPLLACDYWFVRCYIFLYLFSPFLNKLINNLSKKDYKLLIVLMIITLGILPSITSGVFYNSFGYTFGHFCMMYIIGSYFRLYPVKWNKNIVKERIKLIAIFLIAPLINFLLVKISIGCMGTNSLFNNIFSSIAMYELAYNNIFVMIASVAYFLFFLTLHMSSKIINGISKCTFGVYVIHDNVLIRENIYHWFGIYDKYVDSYKYVFYVIFVALLIFVICLVIEKIRQLMCVYLKRNKIYLNLSEWINKQIEFE